MTDKPDLIAEFLKTGKLPQKDAGQAKIPEDARVTKAIQRQVIASILAQVSLRLYEARQNSDETMIATLSEAREKLLAERKNLS